MQYRLSYACRVRSRLQRGGLPGGTGLLLVPAAALLVHQLRYTLAYGSQAASQLAVTGHSYQHSLVPWVILALGVGLSSFLRRTARTVRSGKTGPFAALSATSLWAITTVGLIALYALQESLEELYASGHPTGLGGVVGHGGWWAVPSAAVVARRRRRAAARRPRRPPSRRAPRGPSCPHPPRRAGRPGRLRARRAGAARPGRGGQSSSARFSHRLS